MTLDLVIDRNVESPSLWRRFWAGALNITLVGLSCFAFILVASLIYRAFLNDPPVHAFIIDPTPIRPLCQGEKWDIHNKVVIDRPTMLYMTITVMDEGENYNIPGTSVPVEPKNHPKATQFNQRIAWFVPTLSPGKYRRVVGYRGHDGTQDVLFVSELFTVGEACVNERTEQPDRTAEDSWQRSYYLACSHGNLAYDRGPTGYNFDFWCFSDKSARESVAESQPEQAATTPDTDSSAQR